MLVNLFYKFKNEIKQNIGFVFLFAVLIFVDQFLKFIDKDPFLNYNFAFSLPFSKIVIYTIYFFVLTFLGYYSFRVWKQINIYEKICWSFVFAGAFSNIGERIIFGFVKDFIYIHFGNLVGIYNLADFYIIFGALILFFLPRK